MTNTLAVKGPASTPRSGAVGSAASDIEGLIGAISKEGFGGFRTTEFYVVILTWLLPLATLIWHRDFSSLAVPLSTLAAGIANGAYAISRAMTKSGRARAVAAITTSPTVAIGSVATQVENLASEFQALRTALNQIPPPDTSKSTDESSATDVAEVPSGVDRPRHHCHGV
jgi:hypothetical protein